MHFVELPPFSREIDGLLTAEEFRMFQNELIAEPQKGDILKGTGGARKVRMKYGAKGKSGGARVIYYFASADDRIWLLAAYPKSRKETLSDSEKVTLKALVEKIKNHRKET